MSSALSSSSILPPDKINANNQKSFFARPSTSAGFSALLSPGLERFKEDSVVDTLFSPGDVTFRCGDHPVVDLECGYSGGNGSTSGAVDAGARGDGGGDGSGTIAAGGELSEAGGAAVAFDPLSDVRPRGAAEGERAGAGVGVAQLETPDGNARIVGGEEEIDRPASASAFAAPARRAWVLHNFLAVRGFHRHRLDGIAAWLANSTLSLLSPDLPPDDLGDDLSGGGGGDCGGNGSVGVFRFHRAFDGDSGLPLPGPEGNASSVAASVWVLLLLGDEPDGGNDFPPITHATL